MATDDQALAAALVAIDKSWSEVMRSPFVQGNLGLPIDRLPDIGEAATKARSARAAELLDRIDAVDRTALPHEIGQTLAVARSTVARMATEADHYWLAIDPLGVGFFGLFAPTAYCGGFLLNHINTTLAKHGFETPADLDRYLGLIEDLARLIDQMRERTAGQAERGIRMPLAQLDQSIELVARLAKGTAALVPSVERLAKVGGEGSAKAVAARIAARVDPAWTALSTFLTDNSYRAAAPETVGMAQFPGGAEIYAELVKMHITLDMTPEQVHAEGLKRMAAVRAAMVQLLADIGFAGTPEEYTKAIEADPAWRAEGAEGVGAVFRRYIDRIAPHIDDYFDFKPKAAHDVAPLPAALSASMTFGFYDAPKPGEPIGRYFFNAENLGRNALANVAALNYHELVPGHHFHLATQQENETLHPLRSNAFVNAFNEGWAEYAATLAGEMGMYEQPEERFGRLIMDAFLTCRLVVDTGMNALGWSLEQARDYMRANAFMPETEVRSESVRYSCDIPGQALAYKLGEFFLREQREKMRAAQGDAFDIRRFHDAVLRPGALPLALVAENIERAIA
jgi:uncharacterized protein (DUF885 family)